MSHTLKIKVEIKDETALRTASERTGAKVLGEGSHRLYGGVSNGFGVQLPGWQFPVIVNLQTGELSYDNYGGNWGNQGTLDTLIHEYSTEVVAQALASQGISFYRNDAQVDGTKHTVLCLA